MQSHLHPSSSRVRMLAWKEWNEWKWPFALSTFGILCGLLYDVAYLGNARDPVATYCEWCLLWGMVVPVLIGVRTAASELTQKTLSFSASLPWSMRGLAWARLASAAVIVTGPLIVGGLVLTAFVLLGFGDLARKPFAVRLDWLPQLATGLSILCSEQLGLMLVVAFVGAKRRSETVTGAYGVVISFCQLFLRQIPSTGGLRPWIGGSHWYGALIPTTLMNPTDANGVPRVGRDLYFSAGMWAPLCLHLLILLGLAVCFTRRYGSLPMGSASDANSSWFRAHRFIPWDIVPKRPLTALIWLDFRQALPMAFAGWILALLMTVILHLLNQGFQYHSHQYALATVKDSIVAMGMLWPAVVGAGLFAMELRGDLGHFWRSRPISPKSWYWVKYSTGLIAVLGALDILPFLLLCAFSLTYFTVLKRPGGTFNPDPVLAAFLSLTMIHTACYTLAVLGVCWLRKPTLVAAACIPLLFAADYVLDSHPRTKPYAPTQIMSELGPYSEADLPRRSTLARRYTLTFGSIAALTILGAVVASLAARRSVVKPLTSPLTAMLERRRKFAALETSPSAASSPLNL